MKINLLLSFCLLISFAVSNSAQQKTLKTSPPYSEKTLRELKQLQKAALESNYAYQQTAYLSNNIGARLVGSLQAERAVQYVAAEMRKIGLDVRLQKVSVPHWVRGDERAELIEFEGMAAGTTQKIVLTALGPSVATPSEGLSAEIIVVNSFDELKELGEKNIAGKIVLFNYKFDRQMAESGFGEEAYGQAGVYRRRGAIEAAKYGAIAVLVRSVGGSQNRLAHTGVMSYEENVKKIPAAAVTFEDAELIAYLVKNGKVRMKLVLTPQTLPDTTSYNVIADLKGSENPDEIVIVSGHLDSWDLGTGALDDAVGVAMSMQVPFLLKKLNFKPRRTIRFIAWMSEENRRAGGDAYALEEEPNILNHFAAIECDLGASHPLGFQFTGKSEAMPFFVPLSEILKIQGAGLAILKEEGVAVDIDPLTQKGVPSFAPRFDTRTYFDYHHTAADTLDKVDPEELAENGALAAVLTYGLANLETPLPR